MSMRRNLLSRYRQLGLWARLGAWGSVASIISLAAFFLLPQAPGVSQTATVEGSPGATIIQSGRDTVIGGGLHKVTPIQSLVVEGRLTCTVKPGAELPPAEVPFLPVGDANAYLQGPAGRPALTFTSPVRFRRLEDDRIVVINRFGLPPTSDLQNAPLERLGTFTTLLVPSVTIVYGSAFEKMTMFEVTMTVNGETLWSYIYPLGIQFEQGPQFTIPLQGLRTRIEDAK